MTALGDGPSLATSGGQMQLRALLEVLAPLALAVGVWMWNAWFRGARRSSRRNTTPPRRSENLGMPMMLDMESGSQGNSEQK